MRVLVIGAGASIEEAKRANAPEEFWPPTIANFAKKMWDGPILQFSNYWLSDYLTEQGIDPGNDPTSVFTELAKDPESLINLERLFEYCWVSRGKKFEGDWENLIYHGILNPLSFLLNRFPSYLTRPSMRMEWELSSWRLENWFRADSRMET